MENEFLKKGKQGLMGFRELKTKSGLRELILEQIQFLEKRARAEKDKALGGIVSHFLLLRDQATYKRRLEEIESKKSNPSFPLCAF